MEAVQYLQGLKLWCFGLMMTTAFGCYGSICSWKIVDQDEVDVGLDLGCFFVLPSCLADNVFSG